MHGNEGAVFLNSSGAFKRSSCLADEENEALMGTVSPERVFRGKNLAGGEPLAPRTPGLVSGATPPRGMVS